MDNLEEILAYIAEFEEAGLIKFKEQVTRYMFADACNKVSIGLQVEASKLFEVFSYMVQQDDDLGEARKEIEPPQNEAPDITDGNRNQRRPQAF